MSNLLIIVTVLSSFLANMETKIFQSDFTATVAEDALSPMNYPGSLTMQGQLFKLDMYNVRAAYDGSTLFMYNPEVDELTLSNPTEQELVESNPLLYAKALVPVCNAVERTTQDGKNTIITLTPKDQSIGINRFVLKVRNADLMPLSVEVKEGKKTSSLLFKEPKYIEAKGERQKAKDFFTIPPEKDTYINDMRL